MICSRSEEYSNLSTQFSLNGAICLQPLTNYQIDDYLKEVNCIELRQTINNDSSLLELVRKPLLLSISILAFQEISIDTWQHLSSTTDRIQCLLDVYVIRMLNRDINSKAYGKRKFPNDRQTRLWLVWLAKQLQRESKTEFLIEEMQPYWLLNKSQKQIYKLIMWVIMSLIIWLIMWVIMSLIIWLIFGRPIPILSMWLLLGVPVLIIWLISALILWLIPWVKQWKILQKQIIFLKLKIYILISGLIVMTNPWEIKLRERIIFLKLNSKKIFDALIYGLIVGLIVGLIIGLISYIISGIHLTYGISTLIFRQIVGLISGLFFVLIRYSLEIISLKPELDIKTKRIPNQGIWKSAIHGLLYGLITALIILSIILLIMVIGMIGRLFSIYWLFILTSHLLFFSQPFCIYFVPIALILGLMIGGGMACIKHFCLRFILYHNGYIPWNYARFLNYCTERLFLQRVGGRYRFIHKILQEHFANMAFNTD